MLFDYSGHIEFSRSPFADLISIDHSTYQGVKRPLWMNPASTTRSTVVLISRFSAFFFLCLRSDLIQLLWSDCHWRVRSFEAEFVGRHVVSLCLIIAGYFYSSLSLYRVFEWFEKISFNTAVNPFTYHFRLRYNFFLNKFEYAIVWNSPRIVSSNCSVPLYLRRVMRKARGILYYV